MRRGLALAPEARSPRAAQLAARGVRVRPVPGTIRTALALLSEGPGAPVDGVAVAE